MITVRIVVKAEFGEIATMIMWNLEGAVFGPASGPKPVRLLV